MSTTALGAARKRRIGTDLRPSRRSPAALLGVAALVIATSAIALTIPTADAAAGAFAAVLLAATAFLGGRVADSASPIRVTLVGSTLSVGAIVVALAAPGAAAFVATFAAGVTVPAAFALFAVRTVPAGRVTPRYLLPTPLEVSHLRRPTFRIARAAAITAGSLTVTVAAVDAIADAPAAVAVGAVAVLAAVIAMIATVRLARPRRAAETAGAMLALGALAVAAMALVAAIAGAIAPEATEPWVVIAAGALMALGSLPLLRPTRPARLARPGSAGYRAAIRGYDPSRRRAPAAAAVARSASDVRRLVQQARDAGLPVRVHSTGHSAGSVDPVDGAALIRVLIDEPVHVDPEAGTACIPAGTPWSDVLETIAPHRLGAPHGSSSHVGAVGYLLRGGLSFYGRGRGVAVNSVESFEIVTANSELRTVDAANDRDLYWALRGGGGGFGIVTAVTIRLFPLEHVVTGMVAFEADRARDLARAWVRWAGNAPDEITTSFRVVRMPALPGMPADLRGRPLVVVDGAAHALGADGTRPEDAVATMLDALGAIADPVFDSWRTTTPDEVPYTHVDPPIGVNHDFDHQLLVELGDAGADAFVTAALETEFATAELRQLGGALGRRPADGGALAHYPGAFSSFAVALTGNDPDGARRRLDAIRSALSPWDTGSVVPTFAPDRSRPQQPLDRETVRQSGEIRRRVDPTGVFAGEVAPGA